MDTKKVLEILREIEWVYIEQARHYADTCPLCSVAKPSHQSDCKLAALIAELEHEAQAGGWKPGSEPPDTHRLVALERSDFLGQVSTGLYLESGTRGWLSQSGSPIFRVDRWHDLPPLPEQATLQ